MPAEEPLRDARDFHLIETMRWERGSGIVRRALHMERLAASARSLGFPLDMDEVEAALSLPEPSVDSLRVRLALDRGGGASVQSQPHVPLPAGTVWRLGIASVRVDSRDLLLRHKTSLRSVYEQARAEIAASDADEVLLLNERGEICEGTITSLFVETGDGALVTPPLSCGLLAGVLRAELLATERAREQVLWPSDLSVARRIYVGNSLRGLIEVVAF